MYNKGRAFKTCLGHGLATLEAPEPSKPPEAEFAVALERHTHLATCHL